MNKALIVFIIIGLSACQNRILTSEIETLTANQISSTEDILLQMNTFLEKHGQAEFEDQNRITQKFNKIHKSVLNFMDSLDSIEKEALFNISNDFVSKTFNYFQIEYKVPITITENTNRSIIKLQISILENTYVRAWKDDITFRFNRMEVVIVPDKIVFGKEDRISGKIGLMAYYDEAKPKMKMNGEEIDVEKGWGVFSIKSDNLEEISAEVIFPDTVYTSTLNLIKN